MKLRSGRWWQTLLKKAKIAAVATKYPCAASHAGAIANPSKALAAKKTRFGAASFIFVP